MNTEHSNLCNASMMPGKSGLPFIGEALEGFLFRQQFYLDRYCRYESYFRTKILNTNTAVLFGSYACKTVLQDRKSVFVSRKGWEILEPLLGYGILLQDGKEHKISKKLIGNAFTDLSSEDVFDLIYKICTEQIKNWDKDISLYLYSELKKFTFSVISKIVFGTNENSSETKYLESIFSDLVNGQLAALRINILPTAYGKALRARKQLLSYIKNKVKVTEKCIDIHSGVLANIIRGNSLLSHNERLNTNEIAIQIIQVLFAGYESTASMASWALFSTHSHPDICKKLKNEISAQASLVKPSLSSLNELDFLDKIILETERLFPPVYAIPRGLSQDFYFEDYIIPSSWNVFISPLITHRLESIFDSATYFIPDRFNDVNLQKHLYGFGSGLHKCIGKELAKIEIKILISVIFRFYEFDVNSNQISFKEALKNSDSCINKITFRLRNQSQRGDG